MGGFHLIHQKIEGLKLFGAGLSVVAVLFLALNFPKTPEGSPSKGIYKSTEEGRNDTEDPTRGPNPLASRLSRANRLLLAGRYDEAIGAYRSLVKNNPDFAEARYGLGVSYAKKRLYGAARDELEAAVRLAPEYAEAHHILGLIHLSSGDREGAKASYRILKRLDGELAEELNFYIRNMENFQDQDSPSLP